ALLRRRIARWGSSRAGSLGTNHEHRRLRVDLFRGGSTETGDERPRILPPERAQLSGENNDVAGQREWFVTSEVRRVWGQTASAGNRATKMKENESEVKASIMLLAGDIGGTKTLLGLFDPARGRPAPVVVRSFETLDFADLLSMIHRFLEDAEVKETVKHGP